MLPILSRGRALVIACLLFCIAGASFAAPPFGGLGKDSSDAQSSFDPTVKMNQAPNGPPSNKEENAPESECTRFDKLDYAPCRPSKKAKFKIVGKLECHKRTIGSQHLIGPDEAALKNAPHYYSSHWG